MNLTLLGTKQELMDELDRRRKIYHDKCNKLINLASAKELAHQRMIRVRHRIEKLDREEFEAAQAAAQAAAPKAPTGKGGLALSIEKVFGTQGLELVQRALREEGPGRVQHFEELGPGREQFR